MLDFICLHIYFFSSQFFWNLLSIHKKTYIYTQKMSQIFVAVILDVNGDYESAADGTVKVMSIGNACYV